MNSDSSSVKQELFKRYDRLNELWDEHQQRLVSEHVPFDVGVAKQIADDKQICLGLIRIKGKRRICVAFDAPDNHGDWSDLEWCPVTDCGAEVRLMAIDLLLRLKERVAQSRLDFVPRVDDGIAKLQRMLVEEMVAEL